MNIVDIDERTYKFLYEKLNYDVNENVHPSNLCCFKNLKIRLCGIDVISVLDSTFTKVDDKFSNVLLCDISTPDVVDEFGGCDFSGERKKQVGVVIRKSSEGYTFYSTENMDHNKYVKIFIDEILIPTLSILSQNMSIINQEKTTYRENIKCKSRKNKNHKKVSIVNIPIQKIVNKYCECNKPHSEHSKCIYSFDVRGHYRNYKSGKTVFIKPFEKNKGKPKKDTIYKIGVVQI